MAEFSGDVTFNEQPSELRFRSGGGWASVRVWVGAPQNLDTFLRTALPIGYTSLSIRRTVTQVTVEAEFGVEGPDGTGSLQPADPLTRVWSLVGNDIEESVWALPWIQKVLRQRTAGELAGFRSQLDDAISSGTTQAFGFTELNMLYVLLLQKVETFRISQYVLRKREVVNELSLLKAAHADANRIFTYDTLVAAEPTLPAAALIDAAGLNTPPRSYFWLKGTPTVEEAGRGKFELNQEYLGIVTYDPWVYAPAGDPSPDDRTPGDPDNRLRGLE